MNSEKKSKETWIHFIFTLFSILSLFSFPSKAENDHLCSFVEKFRKILDFECVYWIHHQEEQEFIPSIRSWRSCRYGMMGWLPLEPLLCFEARKRCPLGSRFLIFTPSTPIFALSQILFDHCDIDNVFLHFLNIEINLLESTFQNVNITMNCRYFIIRQLHSEYSLIEIFRMSASSPLSIIDHGIRQLGSSSFYKLPNVYKERKNFNGAQMTMAIFGEKFDDVFTAANFDARFLAKFDMTWKVLTNYLNLSPLKYVFIENDFGQKLNNGTWTGLLGAVQRGEVDLGMAVYFQNPRREAVDYLRAIFRERFMIFLRRSEIPTNDNVHMNWGTFIRPFHWHLWVLLFFILLLLSFWDFVLFGVYNHKWDFALYFESLFFILGAFSLQANDFRMSGSSKRASGKITSLVVFTLSLVVYISYSSCIISFLVSEDTTLVFKDLESFLAFDGNYKIHISKSSPFVHYLDQNSDPRIQQFVNKFLIHDDETTFTGLDNLGFVKKYGYIQLETTGLDFYNKKPYNVIYFPVIDGPVFVTDITPKYSPIQRFINHRLLVHYEVGILNYIQKFCLGEKQNFVNEMEFKSISLEMLLLPISLLLTGYVASVAFLLLEIVFKGQGIFIKNRKKSNIMMNKYKRIQRKYF